MDQHTTDAPGIRNFFPPADISLAIRERRRALRQCEAEGDDEGAETILGILFSVLQARQRLMVVSEPGAN